MNIVAGAFRVLIIVAISASVGIFKKLLGTKKPTYTYAPTEKPEPQPEVDIHTLYRKLAHKYHPDKGNDPLRNTIMARINRAYKDGDINALRVLE